MNLIQKYRVVPMAVGLVTSIAVLGLPTMNEMLIQAEELPSNEAVVIDMENSEEVSKMMTHSVHDASLTTKILRESGIAEALSSSSLQPTIVELETASVAVGEGEITEEEVPYEDVESNVPDEEFEVCNSSNITYMPYTLVTSRTSAQYWVLNDEENAWTDPETGLRMWQDRICIAIGTGWGAKAGDKVDIVTKSGVVIKCIMGDAKADGDTDPSNRYQKYDGSVVEVIVDYNYFNDISQVPAELREGIDKVVVVTE